MSDAETRQFIEVLLINACGSVMALGYQLDTPEERTEFSETMISLHKYLKGSKEFGTFDEYLDWRLPYDEEE